MILYSANLNKRSFGDILSTDGLRKLNVESKSQLDYLQPPTGDTLIAIWPHEPMLSGQLPVALICEDGSQQDWAAWITTYASRIRPFSAYMRLLPVFDLTKYNKTSTVLQTSFPTWPIIGLILTEALSAAKMQEQILELPSGTPYTSTLSFVLFRACLTAGGACNLKKLSDKWENVRKATYQRFRPIKTQDILHVCNVTLGAIGLSKLDYNLTNEERELIDVCKYVLTTGNMPSLMGYHVQDFEKVMHGPREERVVAFEKFLDNIYYNYQSSNLLSFITGFLASRIAPGSVKHVSILSAVYSKFPTAVLWYGFCTGIAELNSHNEERSTKLAIDFPVVSNWIARELYRPLEILSPPLCDISYDEALALTRTSKNPFDGIVKATPGGVLVELEPGVCTLINPSVKEFPEIRGGESYDPQALTALGRQIEKLHAMYGSLRYTNQNIGEQEQQTQFPDRRKKKNWL